MLRAGLTSEKVEIMSLAEYHSHPSKGERIILGLGEKTLNELTGKKSVDKWHLSPLKTLDGSPFIASFDLGRIQKQYECGLYLEMALLRVSELACSSYTPPEERFLLNPSLEETLEVLRFLRTKEEIACDIETGYGQINTIGFAWSPNDAIAINVLPDRCDDVPYFELWSHIADLLEGGSRKIFQNFIYDTSYLSAYGIRVGGEIFDTMHAMGVLWPELDKDLGNVGRIYTKRTYWKDDGRVADEEGKKKDWGAVRDWTRHYTYNCRDTTGTFESAQNQKNDLRGRALDQFYNNYVSRLIAPVREMCAVGMPLCLDTREALKREVEAKLESETKAFHEITKEEINPKSPKQVQAYLKSKGVTLPKKYDKAKGTYKETADASAIKKIRLKYSGLKELAHLQEIASLSKALSSYIDFDVRGDGRLSYSLNITGTETLRWSGGKDAWGKGFNIQTIPREGGEVSIKGMFVAPEGCSFVEIDLRQAESRFVAYDSADRTLIDMLESGADVHSHVGRAILRQMGRDAEGVSKEEFKSTWRQLGKKAGHGLNYGMKASVFVETVFNELDMVITKKDAEAITAAYYGLFPGIPRWHQWIRDELYRKRMLKTPTGWERYFYGRPGDDMFKEAAAFRPQHTIPFLTNHLMLHLCELREEGKLKFQLIDQVHDSLTMLVPDSGVEDIARVALDTKAGHPVIELPGGRMYIPREVKAGKRMSELEVLE